MIYCVTPRARAGELYNPLGEYCRNEPDVEVIIERREGADRRRRQGSGGDDRRGRRDRPRRGIAGIFPSTDVPE